MPKPRRQLLFIDAALVANANVGRGVAWCDCVVSPSIRKSILWAVAWAEGLPITYAQLAALACMSTYAAKAAIYSLEKDGLVRVKEARGRRPSSYFLCREAIAETVVVATFGDKHPKKENARCPSTQPVRAHHLPETKPAATMSGAALTA